MADKNDSLQENNRLIMLEVAFLDYCRFSNINDADINALYEHIEQIKKDYENNDDAAFDKMLKYNLESIRSKEDLKKRINEQKAKIASTIINTLQLNSTDKTGILIKNYMKKLGLAKDADVLTDAMLNKKLDESYDEKNTKADRLSNVLFPKKNQIIENLANHFKKYEQSKQNHPQIAKFLPTIKDYVLNRKHSLKFRFIVCDSDKPFREVLRHFFERRKDMDMRYSEDGVKASFLKVYGAMMQIGKDMLENKNPELGIMMFKRNMKGYFKDNAADEVMKALGISSMEECDAKLIQKSKSLYIKTSLALLSKKKEYDQEHKIYNTDYGAYFKDAINSAYIQGLKLGEDRVKALGLLEDLGPDARLSKSKENEFADALWSDMKKGQHASVHHKIPIGAAKDIIINLFGKLGEEELLRKADELVNVFGNLELVIGREKHQSLEPRDEVVLEAEPNNAIFEARLNQAFVKEICKDQRLPEYIRAEYIKYQNQTDIKETMNFSESPIIAKQRESLNQQTQAVSMVEKVEIYSS